MSGWVEVLLEDVANEITVGYVGPMASEYVENGIPFLRSLNVEPLLIKKKELKYISAEFHQRIRKSRLSTGDVVIVRTGKPGACSVIPEWLTDANCSDLVIVRCGEKINNRFLAYYVNTVASEHIAAHLVGAVQEHFNVGSARSMKINLPSIDEQKSIANVLSSLDDKIDLLHRQNKTLETMAETLFRQWFVEDVPEDWERGNLGDFVTISYGKNLPTSQLLDSGYPVFGGNGQIGFFNKYLYEVPQVLISCRGEASGKVNISLPCSFVTNNSLALEIGKRPEITFEYLKYHSLNYDFTLHVSGSAQPQITIDGLYGADFVLPPIDLIYKFSTLVEQWERKRLNNGKQIQTLEKLRETLLPKLMSGEVRVKYNL